MQIPHIPHIPHPTKKSQFPYIVINYAISLDASFKKMASGNQCWLDIWKSFEYEHA